MSQGQLADAVGVTFQQVQKYEKGTNRVSASRLFQLAQVLGVDVPFFFRDVESANAHQGNRGDVAFDRVDVKFMTSMAKIKDPDIKEKILGVLDSLAEADLPEDSRTAD
jgi:transcriptional regulator with XRE-family HTH domain